MNPAEWLALLRCPVDGGALRAGSLADEVEGWTTDLTCEACGDALPIEEGVVRALGAGAATRLDDPDKEREREARDAGAATYDERFPKNRVALELEPSLAEIRARPGELVIELGAGTGRFTARYAAGVRGVAALDFSLASLARLRARLVAAGVRGALLVHGDVTRPPFAPGAFDRAVSMQVFEHLPTPADRVRAFQAAATLLAPGGELVASVYNWSRWKQYDAARGRGDNTRKEGYHATSPPIYYYNYEADEVTRLVEDAGLSIEVLRGVLLQVPGLLALGAWGAPIHEALARTAFGRRHGHLLLVRARKERGV